MKKLLVLLCLAVLTGAAVLLQHSRQTILARPKSMPDQTEAAPLPSPRDFDSAATIDRPRTLMPTRELVKVSLPKGGADDLAGPPSVGATAIEEPAASMIAPGTKRDIDFDMDESTRSRLTAREQADQLRDWLLFTIVSNSGLSTDEINRALFDLPPIRHAHMRSVANFEYDVTRSCFIGEGRVVALVSAGDTAAQREQLAHIADEHRKNLNEIPKQVLVYVYTIDVGALRGTLEHTVDIAGAELFSQAYGYHEQTIRGRADLEKFLSTVQDVTHASLTGAGRVSRGEGAALVLGGRAVPSRTARGLGVEGVAAVWQAQAKLGEKRRELEAEFEREHKQLLREWQEKLDAMNRLRRGSGLPTGLEGILGNAGKKDEFQKGYDAAAEELQRRYAKRFLKEGVTDGTGFSLDPTYAHEELADGIAAVWHAVKACGEDGGFLGSTAEDLNRPQKSLAAGDTGPLWALMERVSASSPVLGKAFEAWLDEQVESALYGGQFDVARLRPVVTELQRVLDSEKDRAKGPERWLAALPGVAAALRGGDAQPYQQLLRKLEGDTGLLACVGRQLLKEYRDECRAGTPDPAAAKPLLDQSLAELKTPPVDAAHLERVREDLRRGKSVAFDELLKKLHTDQRVLATVLRARLLAERRRFLDRIKPDPAGLAWAIDCVDRELGDLCKTDDAASLTAVLVLLQSHATKADAPAFEDALSRIGKERSEGDERRDGGEHTEREELRSAYASELKRQWQERRPLDMKLLADRVVQLVPQLASLTRPSPTTIDLKTLDNLQQALEDSETEPFDQIERRLQLRSLLSLLGARQGRAALLFSREVVQRLRAARAADLRPVVAGVESLQDKFATLAGEGIFGVTSEDFERAITTLGTEEESVVPLLVLIETLAKSRDRSALLLASGLRELEQRCRFQQARYDGHLQGTEVGMVLFYTDLLAKLWVGVGFEPPRNAIPDFHTMPEGGVAPIYREETVKYPSTRLWFGPEDRGYQIVDERKGVLFARCATRVFAASSNPLEPGQEVPASYSSESRLGWWNDHYEEIARYEGQYERLNDYIKWSVIVGWLYGEEQAGVLDFLTTVEVSDEAWFPDWASAHPELRYQQWEKVSFFPRGHKGARFESLPILFSRPFSNYGDFAASWTISGGVSGGRPSVIKLRPALPKLDLPGAPGTAQKLVMRGVDLRTAPTLEKVTTVRGTVHSFPAAGKSQARMVVKPGESVHSLRSPHAQLPATSLERTINRAGNSTTVLTSAKMATGDTQLGTLRIAPRGNGFRVDYRNGDIDLAHGLARDLSRSDLPPAHFLARDARVEACVQTDNTTCLVKPHGSERWVKLQRESVPSAEIAEGWSSRAADTSVGAENYNIAWCDSQTVAAEMGRCEYLKIELRPLLDQRPEIPVLARGPPQGKLPAGSRPVEIVNGTAKFSGHVDPAGEAVFVRVADLPPELAQSPEGLVRVLRSTDGPAFRSQLRVPQGKPRLGSGTPVSGSREPLIAALEKGDARAAARFMAEAPTAARKVLATDLDGRIGTIDRYLAQRRHTEGLGVIEDALKVHPDQPELLLRKGVAEIERGRLQDALALNIPVRKGAGKSSFLDQITRLQGKCGPRGQAYLNTQRQAAELADLKASRATRAEGRPAVVRERVELEVDLPEQPKPGAKVKAAELPPGAELYVDDVPGLNNLDWSPAARQKTVQQALEGGAALYPVEQPDAVLRLFPGSVRVRHGQTTGRYLHARVLVPLPPPRSVIVPGDDDDDEDTDADAATTAGDAPIYFLTKAP